MGASSTSPVITGHNADRPRSRVGAWLASYDSQNTRAAYRRDLLLLLRHLDVHGTDLLTARHRDLDLFARAQRHTGASAATVTRRLAAASAFYRYAVAEEWVGVNPAHHLRRPRVDPDETTTAGLSRRQAEDLLTCRRGGYLTSHQRG